MFVEVLHFNFYEVNVAIYQDLDTLLSLFFELCGFQDLPGYLFVQYLFQDQFQGHLAVGVVESSHFLKNALDIADILAVDDFLNGGVVYNFSLGKGRCSLEDNVFLEVSKSIEDKSSEHNNSDNLYEC